MSPRLGASVAVHAALLTVRLVDPQAFNRVFEDTPLEVVLVNARGARYVNETLYGAAIGDAMVEKNDGRGYIILDRRLRHRLQCHQILQRHRLNQ